MSDETKVEPPKSPKKNYRYNIINSWTPDLENNIRETRSKAKAYIWIHKENSGYLGDIHKWLMIIAGILSFLSGVIGALPIQGFYLSLINLLVGGLGTTLLVYLNSENLTQNSEKHKVASGKWSGIVNNIERQLSMPPQYRENGATYHRWINQQYDTLFSTAPDIDGPIIDKYKEAFASKRKHNPEEAAECDSGRSYNYDQNDYYHSKSNSSNDARRSIEKKRQQEDGMKSDDEIANSLDDVTDEDSGSDYDDDHVKPLNLNNMPSYKKSRRYGNGVFVNAPRHDKNRLLQQEMNRFNFTTDQQTFNPVSNKEVFDHFHNAQK